ncbi:MAG TPA: hypothetical protein VF531_03535 [Bacillota bacterium]
MLDPQLSNGLESIKQIVEHLHRVEQDNAALASQLAQEEYSIAADLNRNLGNVPALAANARQAAAVFSRLAADGTHAAEELAKLNEVIVQFQNEHGG